MRPVGTKENTTDLGTKPLSGSRVRLLMGWLGFFSEGKPVGEKEQCDYMESKQIGAMVQRVRCVGNFALAALLLGTGVVGSEGAKVMSGNTLLSCQFAANMSCAVMFSEHASHDARSHVQGMYPMLHCMRCARERERERERE